MFSGIVSFLQPVKDIKKTGDIFLVSIKKPKKLNPKIGESVCINGVCSTVIKKTASSFKVEYMPETLNKTTFKNLQVGHFLNLETSLKLNDLVSGHLVSGHIDCTGEIKNIILQKNFKIFTIKYPLKFSKFLIEKGSVAIDGISLTVFNLKQTSFQVSLISHTIKNTNLQFLKKGDKVNLEFDLIGKYINKITK